MGSINGISPATEQVGSLAPSDKFEGTRSSADEHVKEKRLATNASITVASIGTIISASITASITVARKFLQRFRWKSKDRDFNGLDDSFLHFSGHEAQPHDTTPTQAHFTDAPPAQVLSTDQAPEKTSSTTDTSLSARGLANHVSFMSTLSHHLLTDYSLGLRALHCPAHRINVRLFRRAGPRSHSFTSTWINQSGIHRRSAQSSL
jgi:hypothetical protein